MSMPEFPKLDELTLDKAINSILVSIAMEEAALSHILNAEGEKIQFVLAHKCVDVQKVIDVNDSVASMISKITDLQSILKSKMQLANEMLDKKSCRCMSFPQKPHRPC